MDVVVGGPSEVADGSIRLSVMTLAYCFASRPVCSRLRLGSAAMLQSVADTAGPHAYCSNAL